jgi:hypothetical protein
VSDVLDSAAAKGFRECSGFVERHVSLYTSKSRPAGRAPPPMTGFIMQVTYAKSAVQRYKHSEHK